MPISPQLDFPSRETIKNRVKEFWNKGQNSDLSKLTITALYNFASKLYGYEDWNHFSAALNRNDETRQQFEEKEGNY